MHIKINLKQLIMKYKLLTLLFILLSLTSVLQAKTKKVHAVMYTDSNNPFLKAVSDFIMWLPTIKTQLADINNKASYSAVYDHLGLIAADLQRLSDTKSDLKDIIAAPNGNDKEIKAKINFIVSELVLLKSDLSGIGDYLSQSDHADPYQWLNKIKTEINGKLKDMGQFKRYLLSNNGKLDQEEAQLDHMKTIIKDAIKNIENLRDEIKPLR